MSRFRSGDPDFGRGTDMSTGRVEPGFSQRHPAQDMRADHPYHQHPGYAARDDFEDEFGFEFDHNAEDEAAWRGIDPALAAPEPEPRRWASIGNGFAAVASLALLAGVGWWGQDLVMRDVTGIPVVRALDGPMRSSPENPGGQLAAHQGLSVNSVAAQGGSAKPADQLTLAPPPVGLAEEDQTAAALPAAPAEPETAAVATDPALAALAPALDEVAEADPAQPVSDGLPQITSIQSTQMAESGTPLDLSSMAERIANGTLGPTEDTPGLAVRAEPLPPGQLTVPAPNTATATTERRPEALRPRLRPEGLRVAAAAPAQAPVATTTALSGSALDSAIRATLTTPVSAPASGGRKVQMGAMASPAQAEQEWRRLQSILGPDLSRYEQLTEEGVSGGRQIYRLRVAGFADADAASRFCATVVSRGPDCIVVPTR